MKPVNLLPQRHRPAGASGGKRGNGHLVLGGLAALLAITVLYVLTANAVTARKDETVRLEREAALAEAQAAELGDYGDFRALKTSRTAAVRDLAAARFDWERVLREVARVLPSGVRLTNIDGSAPAPVTGDAAAAAPAPGEGASEETAAGAGPTVSLGGCAPDHRTVATVLVRLRTLHQVEEVSLSESARGGSEGDGAASSSGGAGSGCSAPSGHSWSATISFAPADPAAPAPARAPESLGGGA